MARRGDDFAEHLASQGSFVAGSSGVQGEWPKVLMARASDGLLYLDHTQVCLEPIRHCTNPQEVMEYIKRDIANLALGNKDNHARNTAVQRRFDGHIALTPLYDFAPMYVHPDGVGPGPDCRRG